MKVWALTDGEVSEGKYLVVRRDGTIPDWGHFVLASVDPCAAAALRAYAKAARTHGFEDDFCASVEQLAEQYEAIAAAHAVTAGIGLVKQADPDKGPHRIDNPAIVRLMRGRGDLTDYMGPDALPDALNRETALKGRLSAAQKRHEELESENDELRGVVHELELDLAHVRGRMAEVEASGPPEMAPVPKPAQFASPLDRHYGARPRDAFSAVDRQSGRRQWFHRGPR